MPRPMPAVAVIADAHFHDMGSDYGGAGMLWQGQRLVAKAWRDTAMGTRAVNESADALNAALEHCHRAGVRLVVLLGDYSDDGQREGVARLAALLRDAEARLGLRFFALPGNHDLYASHGKHTATRYLSAPGVTRLVTSDPMLAAAEPDAILTQAVHCAGLPEALLPMAGFGLFRQPGYLHWETPFGASDAIADREFEAVAADGSVRQRLMDASYLVEPAPGLWLLMLDANVFEPRPGITDPARKRAFLDPAEAGWPALLRVKPFLLRWIADVAARVQAEGKTLLTFSHYPAADPFEDTEGDEAAMFGSTVMARRIPGPQVAAALAEAGIPLHIGGHLHVNSTTQVETPYGPLTNIAAPALVSFPGAFKILRPDAGGVAVETVSLADLPADPMLTALYATEGAPPLDTFGDLLRTQFRARVQARDLLHDWPEPLRAIEGASAADAGLHGTDLAAYPLRDLITDWYCLRQAGPLARDQIAPDRLRLLRALAATPQPDAPEFLHRFVNVLARSLRRMDRDDTRV